MIGNNFNGEDENVAALKFREAFEGSGLLQVLHDVGLALSDCFRPQ